MLAFTLALLYPLTGLCAPVGHWQWDGSIPGSTASSVSVSLVLTGIALLFDVILGTPVAWYLARHTGRDKIIWEAAVLISVLMPPLALGILLSLAFGPTMKPGAWLLRMGLPTSNSPLAFVATQFYVSVGYYIVAARAALAAVPERPGKDRRAAWIASVPGISPGNFSARAIRLCRGPEPCVGARVGRVWRGDGHRLLSERHASADMD